MTLARWRNVLYVCIVAVEGIHALSAGDRDARRPAILHWYVKGGLVAAVVGAVTLSPQLLAWTHLCGVPTLPLRTGYFDMLHRNLPDYLFFGRHGLYSWHRVILLATLGLVLFWQRDGRVALALVVPLLVQWYLNSGQTQWWAQCSFGARRFISTTSLLALGMAALAESVVQRLGRRSVALVAAVAALVGWNFLFDLQYSWGFIPREGTISFHQLTFGKLEMILELIGRVINVS